MWLAFSIFHILFPLIFSRCSVAFAISFRRIPFTLQRFVLTCTQRGESRARVAELILCLIRWESATTFVRFGSDKCSVKAASTTAIAPVLAPSLASCLELQIRKVFAIYAQV